LQSDPLRLIFNVLHRSSRSDSDLGLHYSLITRSQSYYYSVTARFDVDSIKGLVRLPAIHKLPETNAENREFHERV